MAEAKENVHHLYPFAVALPTVVLWFTSLSPLESKFSEVRDCSLSIFYPWQIGIVQHTSASPSCQNLAPRHQWYWSGIVTQCQGPPNLLQQKPKRIHAHRGRSENPPASWSGPISTIVRVQFWFPTRIHVPTLVCVYPYWTRVFWDCQETWFSPECRH